MKTKNGGKSDKGKTDEGKNPQKEVAHRSSPD